jgi:hypothetical protein
VAGEHDEFVVDYVPRALADLRDPVAFYDPHRHHLARTCLLAACERISAGHERVDYSFSNAIYRIDGIDSSRLADLAAATADPGLNLFEPLYRDSVLPELARDRPDVVGVSILNGQQILPGLRLARVIKEAGHFVVIGGTVYSKFVPELLRRPEFFELFCDGLVPYEGETAFVSLLHELDGRRDLTRVPNLMVLDRHGTPSIGPTRAEDVARLPTPDFGDLPLRDYLAPAPVLPLLLGKGCYFNRCKFCDIPFINSVAEQPYRVRPPERVAGDVATLRDRHGARCFELTDETLSPRSLVHLGEALAARGVDARFVGYARFERGFTPDVCERLYAMGLRKLFFGLESANQATLDHMRKGIRVETAYRVLRACRDAGIGYHVFSIIGFPEEPESSARDTLRFFEEQGEIFSDPRNSFDIHGFGLDLRTPYADEPGRYGVEIDQADLSGRDFPISVLNWRNTRGMSGERVEELLGEFARALRERFRDSLWPAFEEYAVLYAEHYEGSAFEYRLSLPEPGDPLRFSLAWAADVRVAGASAKTVRTLTASTTVGAAAVAVLAVPAVPMTVDELLETLAERFAVAPGERAALIAELRVAIDRLLGVRALCLVPAAGSGVRIPAIHGQSTS